ncbi:MAG: calcineurin-like phosphoesterase C-terminal domain-containing protein, partial [Verrucomicrobiae bacterium]|nr:calcineurin-like phosphoesterase C-terminal domain-containing protein [Verrucomicrobiae bacterium]
AKTPETSIYVNVFNGSEKSTVRMKLDSGESWLAMEKALEPDPYYVEIRDREMAESPEGTAPLNAPIASAHLWKANLPGGLKPGSHLIEIEATDAYDRLFRGKRIIRVVE